MRLPTIAELPYTKTPRPALKLAHKLVPVRHTQARLRWRHVLEPDLDLGAYRFRAVVDWIRVRVAFARGTQRQHLQTILRPFLNQTCKIDAADMGPGDVFTRCAITIQEPTSLARVVKAQQALVAAYGEVEPAQITGIEISIDAYPKTGSQAARALLLGAMQRTIWTDRDIWTNPNSRPRSVFGSSERSVYKISPGPEHDLKGEKRILPQQHRAPALDATMVLGAQDDAIMIRVMDKLLDRQHPDGSRDVLEEDQRRVRIEVMIQGAELPAIGLTGMDSLQRFRFITLQKRYFQFRLPTFDVRIPVTRGSDLVRHWSEARKAEIYLRGGVTALMSRDKGWENKLGRFRKKVRSTLIAMGKATTKRAVERRAPAFVSYEDLNRKVVDALQTLEKREQTAWNRFSV